VAIAALFVYPIVWLILLPFRIIGVAVGGVLELIWGIVTLPVTVLRRLARA
jgi:fatty-acid desaturase